MPLDLRARPGAGADGAAAHRTRRVWVVSELYFPEQTSTGHVFTELAEGLAEHHEVHVLCGQPTYSARGIRAPIREQRHGVSIIRCAGTTFDKDRLLFRLVNMFTLSVSMWVTATRAFRQGDIVLVVTTPPVLPFWMVPACRLRRAFSVLVIHDLYPNAAVAAGMLRADSPATAFLDFLHARLYSAVDRICVVGRDMRALILQKIRATDSERVIVIPNWADSLTPAPSEDNSLLLDLQLTEKFVLLHAGNMGRVQAVEALFQAACELNQRDPSVHFLFIGSGAKRRWLETAIREHALSNVTVLDHRPRSEQQTFLNASHVVIFGFVRGMAGAGVPSRLYNAMAVGRPMIAAVDADSEPALVIREEDIGWVVPPDEPERIVDAICAARADPVRLAEMGRRARRAVDRRFERSHAIHAYRTLIEGIDNAGA